MLRIGIFGLYLRMVRNCGSNGSELKSWVSTYTREEARSFVVYVVELFACERLLSSARL